MFIACGWFGLSIRRFLGTTIITSFAYTAVMLSVATLVGETVITHFGHEIWAVVAAFLAIILFVGLVRPGWNLLPRLLGVMARETALQPSAGERAVLALPPGRRITACRRCRRSSGRSRWPSASRRCFFYVPIAAQWIYLGLRYGAPALPSAANPRLQAGGLFGESKSDCLRQVGPAARRWFAPFVTVTVDAGAGGAADTVARAVAAMAAAELAFPVVAKPDIGWRGFGVPLVETRAELADYLAHYPADKTVILQQPVAYDGEAGLFYVRQPDAAKGSIFSLTFWYYPHVVGDGRSTVRQLIWGQPRANAKAGSHFGIDPLHGGVAGATLDPVPAAGETVRLSFIGSNRVGGLYRDAGRFITPALTERFDEIAWAIPEFYVGRFDLRFASVEALQRGEDFRIIAINGAGSEAIHVWDPDMRLADIYRTLFHQQRLIFEIARNNRARGFRPISLLDLYRFHRRQQRLIPLYPRSGVTGGSARPQPGRNRPLFDKTPGKGYAE